MIPWAKPSYHGFEKKFVLQALKSTWLSDGKFVHKLENKIAKYINSKFAITVTNATNAVQLVFLAMGLKRGDEIIVPGYGYLAAANLALQMGLIPIFADVDQDTFCVTAKNIKKKIHTKQN